MDGLIYKEESFRIVGAAMEVWNVLGYGFLESVYEEALVIELRSQGLRVGRQARIPVRYKEQPVGEFVADVVVNESIILELKTVEKIAPAHTAQALNYLKATGYRLAIVLNFAKERLEYKRLVL